MDSPKKTRGSPVFLFLFVLVSAAAIATVLAWRLSEEVDNWLLVRERIAQSEYEQASQLMKTLDPAGTNWRTHWLRARIYRRTGKLPEARIELIEADNRGGDRETLEREQLLCLAAAGRMSECEPDMKRLFEDPRGDAAEIAAAYALGFYRTHEYHRGDAIVDAWKLADPANAEPLYLEGLSLEFTNDLPNAMKCYQRALELNPRHWRIRFAAAELHFTNIRLEDAAAELETITQQVPDETRPWLLLGLVRLRLGETETAAHCLAKLRELRASENQVCELAANLAAAQSDWKTAESAAQTLLELEPQKFEIIVLLVRCYAATGRADETVPLLEKLNAQREQARKREKLEVGLLSSKHRATDLIAIGDVARDMKTEGNGLPWYQAAVEYAPQNKTAHLRLARHFRETGEVDLAEKHEQIAATCPELESEPASKAKE